MQEALELVEIMRQEIGPGDPPLSLVFALILVESGGLREVRSTKGAVGLMQIMPETGAGIAQELGWRDFRSRKLLRARINIQLGLWYLRYLFEAFPQSERAALAAYYWGPGTIRRRLEQGERLPRQYPGKIRKIQRRLKEYMNHGRQIHYRQCRPG